MQHVALLQGIIIIHFASIILKLKSSPGGLIDNQPACSLAAPPFRIERKGLASVVSKSCTTSQGFVRANQIAEARDVFNLL